MIEIGSIAIIFGTCLGEVFPKNVSETAKRFLLQKEFFKNIFATGIIL